MLSERVVARWAKVNLNAMASSDSGIFRTNQLKITFLIQENPCMLERSWAVDDFNAISTGTCIESLAVSYCKVSAMRPRLEMHSVYLV